MKVISSHTNNFANSNLTKYIEDIHRVFELINKWLICNHLSLKSEKTQYIYLITKNKPTINKKFGYDKLISNNLHTKCIGIHIDINIL